MNKIALKKKRIARRRKIIKKRFTKNKLRLCINKSNYNFYAQIIDDSKGNTVVGVSTLSSEVKDVKNRSNIDAAKILGKLVATKATEKGISEVFFDRNGYLYHGKIKAFADAARENGLKF